MEIEVDMRKVGPEELQICNMPTRLKYLEGSPPECGWYVPVNSYPDGFIPTTTVDPITCKVKGIIP